jgi:hypothetical protein
MKLDLSAHDDEGKSSFHISRDSRRALISVAFSRQIKTTTRVHGRQRRVGSSIAMALTRHQRLHGSEATPGGEGGGAYKEQEGKGRGQH